MKRSDFRCLDRLRVRWAEVDLQKIVFNGHYLMYFDTAVASYGRALGLPYHDAMALLGGDLYVRKATLEYEASARYDEQLAVGIRCARIGNSSLRFAAAVFRGEQRLAHGELVYVVADPATQTSQPLPPALRAVLEGYEAGQAMVAVQAGRWDALATEVRALREAAFVAEQGLPATLVEDAADAQALQLVLRNRLGMVVACGRLLEAEQGVARVGRIATLAAVRGAGLGQALLDALVAAAAARGDRELRLTALAGAASFYERAGWRRLGAEVFEDGRPHVPMGRAV